ncbi:LOW QUALITY PROTEIN: protein YIPF1-like [Brienomyrus brachyistius]|uniref:LOW QUALITY PROTEIN: protein YIPF1-like n=1 Tax=Brienomyrus brachyistius TaxID=42636 RepID=UPI0020B23643|nr:LOW QUALITY PROTEIN: protein YIPF1-like [Brienomyrus brachyistius]
MATPDALKFKEYEETSEFLFNASSVSTDSKVSRGSVLVPVEGSVKLDLSEDEEEEDQEEKWELLGGQRESSSFWTFEYYQSFFNVDTLQVLDRVRGSLLPLPGRNIVKHHLRSNPDLYGPFWICVTLVFSMTISGNISAFLSQMGDPKYQYRPHFHRVSVAAVTVFSYAWLVPLGLWGFLTLRQGADRRTGGYSFLETVCVYGYTLFLYIPTTMLWTIPLEWLSWLLILVTTAISGSVLVSTFWPMVREDSRTVAITTLVTVLLLHAFFTIGCKLYFFQTAVRTGSPSSPLLHSSSNITGALTQCVQGELTGRVECLEQTGIIYNFMLQ